MYEYNIFDMQIFIHYDKTYTLEVSNNLSFPELRRLIYEKTNIPIDRQFILHNGRIVNHFRSLEDTDILPDDTLRVFARILGGNFISTGNLLIALGASLAGYFAAFPVIFYGLDFLTSAATANPSPNKYLSYISNYNALQLLPTTSAPLWYNIIKDNSSFLLYLYLAITLLLWILYSSTITIIINSYYRCTNNKMSGNQIAAWLGIFLGYLLMYPIIYMLSNKWFIGNYTIAIFTIISAIFLMIYSGFAATAYNFNIMTYIAMTVIVLFLYYTMITVGGYSGIKLFVIIPMLGSFYYIVNYLMEYFANFSEIC